MLGKILITAGAAFLAVFAWTGSAGAGDAATIRLGGTSASGASGATTMRLGGTTATAASAASDSDTMRLLLKGDAETLPVRGWGGYRGGWGGYRGGWGYGGYRGWGWGGYRGGWGYGGYRGWGWGGYRGWGWGGYTPYYWGGYSPYFYNYGYSPYCYTPSYYYSGYSYYTPTVSVVPPYLAYYYPVNGAANSSAASDLSLRPGTYGDVPGRGQQAPSSGEQTFPYDGGPRSPVPTPNSEPAPIRKPQPTAPLDGRLVSAPAKLPQFSYLAYGETAPPATPRSTVIVSAPATSKVAQPAQAGR